jgi:hypothetical protein
MTEILNKNYNLFQKKSVGLQGISIQLLLISYVMIGQETDSNNKTATTYVLPLKPILQRASTGAAVIIYIGFDSKGFDR